jgi:hypothetical protein
LAIHFHLQRTCFLLSRKRVLKTLAESQNARGLRHARGLCLPSYTRINRSPSLPQYNLHSAEFTAAKTCFCRNFHH